MSNLQTRQLQYTHNGTHNPPLPTNYWKGGGNFTRRKRMIFQNIMDRVHTSKEQKLVMEEGSVDFEGELWCVECYNSLLAYYRDEN